MELLFPIEFLVEGTPVSFQSGRPESKNERKARVKAASSIGLPAGHNPSNARMAVTLYYFPSEPIRGPDMNPAAQEAAVLENIVPQLEAEGFEVITRPARHRLPRFMQSYTPDAIALREDRNLAIEVLRKGSSSEKGLAQLRDLLNGHRQSFEHA